MSDETPTEKLEGLWAAHLAHCWQCADFSRPCLLGRTLEDAVLQRWIKDFRRNPELFVRQKEGILEHYRQQVGKYLQQRFEQRLRDTALPADFEALPKA